MRVISSFIQKGRGGKLSPAIRKWDRRYTEMRPALVDSLVNYELLLWSYSSSSWSGSELKNNRWAGLASKVISITFRAGYWRADDNMSRDSWRKIRWERISRKYHTCSHNILWDGWNISIVLLPKKVRVQGLIYIYFFLQREESNTKTYTKTYSSIH